MGVSTIVLTWMPVEGTCTLCPQCNHVGLVSCINWLFNTMF